MDNMYDKSYKHIWIYEIISFFSIKIVTRGPDW